MQVPIARFFIFAVISIFLNACGFIKYSVNGVIPPFAAAVDFTCNRVLLARKRPSQNFESFDLVLGQPDFTSGVADAGAGSVNSQGLNSPTSVLSDGTRLYVSDGSNHRILVWNQIPNT